MARKNSFFKLDMLLLCIIAKQDCYGYEITTTKDFEHERLRDTLKNIKGNFLLSYDDSPKIRELYKDFEMVEVQRQKGINNRQGIKNNLYYELLIANYPIKEKFQEYVRANRNKAK